MEPTAIILVFTFLALLIIFGITILGRSIWRLWKQRHEGRYTKRQMLLSIFLDGPIAMIGLFMAVYGTRSVYRLIFAG